MSKTFEERMRESQTRVDSQKRLLQKNPSLRIEMSSLSYEIVLDMTLLNLTMKSSLKK